MHRLPLRSAFMASAFASMVLGSAVRPSGKHQIGFPKMGSTVPRPSSVTQDGSLFENDPLVRSFSQLLTPRGVAFSSMTLVGV